MVETSLKDKTVKGVAWSGIDNVAQFGVSFVVSIVLARLLTPDDYGLLGIIAIFTAISTALINGGFANALIRKKSASDDDYNTAFWVNLVMSVLLYAIIFLCAPLIADFFNRAELVALTRVATIGLIFGALSLVQQTRLTKRIDFKTQTRITIIASFCSGAIGILFALIGFGVWSLVAQQLSSSILRTILLWLANKWVPGLHFSKKSFQDLFGFGWKIMVSGLIDSIWKELYQVVVGKFYSPATLGQYTRAKQFSQLFSSNLTIVIQRVTFPVLSTVQDNKEKMVAGYRRIIKITMFITAISMFFLGAVSEPLLNCLIGAKWKEAATYLPLICITGSLYPLHAINLNMLQVQGRSDLYLGLEIVKKCIGVIPLMTCVFYGIMPMLYVHLVTGFIIYLLNSYFPGKLIGYSAWMQIKDVAPSYIIATTIAISVWFLKYLPLTYWAVLPIQIVVGFFVFITLCKISNSNEYIEIKTILKSFIAKIHR